MPDIIPAPFQPPRNNPPSGSTAAAGINSHEARERKEERRRERRERRENRRQRQRQTELSNHIDAYMYEGGGITHTHHGMAAAGNNLPDLVNHQPPPPYSTLPPQGSTSLLCPSGAPGGQSRGGGWRASISSFSRRRQRCGAGAGPPLLQEDETKPCCGVLVSQSVSIRWFIVMIAFVGICCAVVGTVLGAMKATGREHLTVSLLMIGVGVVLITVSGIAWRMTSRDAPSCRAMMGLDPHAEFGLGGALGAGLTNGASDSRFLPARGIPFPRGGNTNGTGAHHPYAGMLYSEFQYRPPPPSYQASMQEYRLRLLLMDRGTAGNASQQTSGLPHPPGGVVSPPPAYRGRGLMPPLPDVSRPPSYRSRASDPSSGHHGIHHHPAMIHHARHSSQLSYLSAQTIAEDPTVSSANHHLDGKIAVVDVVSGMGGDDIGHSAALEHASVVPVLHSSNLPVRHHNMHKASIIIQQDKDGKETNQYIANIQNQFDSEHSKLKDGHGSPGKHMKKDDVTIVQKEEEGELSGGVVVTVSATVDRHNTSSTCSTPEVDILAHL